MAETLWRDFEFRATFPLRRPGTPVGGTNGAAHVTLTRDLTGLLPYLHSVSEWVRCFDDPPHALFGFEGITCTLRQNELTAAAFPNADAARGFVLRLADVLTGLERRRSTLKPEFRPARTGSILEILRALPRSSCGECGLGSCTAFAVSLSRGEVFAQRCPHMPTPVAKTAEYPVYDADGVLRSTVSLPVGEPDTPSTAAHSSGSPAAAESRRYRVSLTERELDVLGLLVAGATNPEIAAELDISAHTVKTHVTHIFDKLGARDRTEAAVLAVRLQLV